MSEPDTLTQDVQHVPIERVRAHPANPREGDVGAIWESIQENGFFGALVVQESSGCILAGNHRWMAAKEAGMQEVPVIYVDVDDERAMRILLADNRTNDVASYDGETLADLLEHLESTDDGLAGTGYDGDALDELLHDLERDKPGAPLDDEGAETDRAEELREEWQTERGQLWQIGRHRLLCGDATDGGHVEQLLDGAEPRLMVTDPPYGVEYDANWRNEKADSLGYGERRTQKVQNDDVADWRDVLAPFSGEVIYCWHAGRRASETHAMLEDSGFPVRTQIIWVKSRFAISQGHYHWQHEPCWYAVRKNGTAQWAGDRSQTTVWEISLDENVDGGHSTQKPLECMQRPIRNHKGDVYEPFCGSGTTIIAAENEGRTCYAMEITPAYCAVILERCTKAGLECKLIHPSA